ncbi:alpha-L-arabinofuranosidase 1-like [Amaranthus tricolor]|uniref:alpha-L-arabinofuranosidase 1-like n=1 Tax=Amaranthus tricolor TaxID=29722 RepID=UPI00258D17A1|nr:alpha-L-arabinofuranosidase 1-like [Amaranthus tricolor]XP_057547584.1 alpha-L-arabinofuranosidase 1-like [Amaranthus tricolor]XP_057547585.1 alpha-L-arabinofuranosidase 1-like [Amaranthus tricolor]XP_057547586.1 alpha-L-arabinofuranosidase 1-like [Amaranthus tricolor]
MGGYCLLLLLIIGSYTLYNSKGIGRFFKQTETAALIVDASASGRTIPDTLFGIFFEEINHAGSGGLWAELVSNRGFEAGGHHTPSNIKPWSLIGDESTIMAATELSSCFERNKVALRMDVLCDDIGPKVCPKGGVGVYNPGFWGMNIEQGNTYKVVFYVRSAGSINVDVSLASSNGREVLATVNVIADALQVANWTRMEVMLEAKSSNSNSRLQLTTTKKGVLWIDQVSGMPTNTYKGHGFRKDLFEKLVALEPRFLRFPGGCFVEGEWLRNAFRWKETIGPWEERPGHLGDVWMYWTDDGLGYFEFLQLAEDLGTAPVWVINNGIGHRDQVETAVISAFVQEMLDSIEFARGDPSSKWGSLRAAMGHPAPFDLKYIAIGNEDCGKPYYRGNYLEFFTALRKAYPDIQVISNCDGSSTPLDHPADLYDFHIYTSANDMFSKYHKFDNTRRRGPKAFVSEYAVTGKDAGKGSLLAALAEAAFLMGLEKNSDVVQMASYAPLFVNTNDRRWNPDAIVYDSSRVYGTPSYWMQLFFAKSSGATLLKTGLRSSSSLVASAISWNNATDNKNYITIKIVNFANRYVKLKLSIAVNENSVRLAGSKKTVLTSNNVMDENSFRSPKKVVPFSTGFTITGKNTDILLQPYSFTSFDVVREQPSHLLINEADFGRKSSS